MACCCPLALILPPGPAFWLGRCDPTSASPHIGHLVAAAAQCVRHPAGSMKLSGTALTLLGGMALWYVEQPASALEAVLEAVAWALQQHDDKLTRNAATTVNRWVQVAAMSRCLLAQQMGFVKRLLALLPGPLEVLKHTTGEAGGAESLKLLHVSAR